jgi:hypothetical protein
VIEAHARLVDQLSLLFTNTTDSLSTTQINFLRALLANESQFSSQDTLNKYQLGTSANIPKIKKALLGREIIDIIGKKIEFQDPIYKYWLQKCYFVR